jgi:integrase
VHRAQWTATLKAYAYPVIGDLAPSEITTEHVREILQPIWHSKPETARRLRGRIERVLDAAKVLGMRDGQNPAAWTGHLSNVFPGRKKKSVKHHPAMPWRRCRVSCIDCTPETALRPGRSNLRF